MKIGCRRLIGLYKEKFLRPRAEWVCITHENAECSVECRSGKARVSEEHLITIVGSETARKELQDRFSGVGITTKEVELKTLSAVPYLAMPVLWVTYKLIRQLTPILFEFKRSKAKNKTSISIKLVVGERQGKRREIPVENEQEFEKAAQEGLNEIHITDFSAEESGQGSS
jgi:hypothetical protein